MKKVRILSLILLIFLLCAGCGNYTTVITGEDAATGAESTDSDVAEIEDPIVYMAMMYDNHGNNFLNFEGNSFAISPNKAKQYGWSSDGTWTRYYETSSVVTIEVDGHYIQSCGSTVIFKDKRLEMLEIPGELSTKKAESDDGYVVTEERRYGETYMGLTNWWYGISEKGQHGKKLIIVQSQDGYNIGAFTGDDITWEIAEKLPKTTRIMVDGKPLYIHRCNFTIIDVELLE